LVSGQNKYRTISKSSLIVIAFLVNRHFFLPHRLLTESQIKMPKLKLFKHLPITRKKLASLQIMSPSLPEGTNQMFSQHLPSSSVAQITISTTSNHSSRITEAIPTLTPADRITNDQTNTPSTPTTAHVSNVSETQTLSSQLADPQQPTSPLILTDIPEFLTAQVNGGPHKPDLLTRSNTTKRRHQYRLCYNCRQTGHLKKHCTRFLEQEH